MLHQENRSRLQSIAAAADRQPQFTQLHGREQTRRWRKRLTIDFALWRQGAQAWRDTEHACIVHGPADADGHFAEDIAEALALDCTALDASGWRDAKRQSAVQAIEAIVAAFDEACRNAPCVLSFDALHDLSAPASASALHVTAVTAALRAEIEAAWHVPGLVLVGTVPACEAVALSLALPNPAADAGQLLAAALRPPA